MTQLLEIQSTTTLARGDLGVDGNVSIGATLAVGGAANFSSGINLRTWCEWVVYVGMWVSVHAVSVRVCARARWAVTSPLVDVLGGEECTVTGNLKVSGGDLEVSGTVFTGDLIVRGSSSARLIPSVSLPALNVTGVSRFFDVRAAWLDDRWLS